MTEAIETRSRRRVYVGFRVWDPARKRTSNVRGATLKFEGFTVAEVREFILEAARAAGKLRKERV
jgi:hypothetical protein